MKGRTERQNFRLQEESAIMLGHITQRDERIETAPRDGRAKASYCSDLT